MTLPRSKAASDEHVRITSAPGDQGGFRRRRVRARRSDARDDAADAAVWALPTAIRLLGAYGHGDLCRVCGGSHRVAGPVRPTLGPAWPAVDVAPWPRALGAQCPVLPDHRRRGAA